MGFKAGNSATAAWRLVGRILLGVALATMALAQSALAGTTVLHHFAGGTNDGWGPNGSLLAQGATFYGMAGSGGVSNRGVVFRMSTNGASFSIIHHFAGGAGDGNAPRGSLTPAGDTLYGMTRIGGTSNIGVAFRMNTNGSQFVLLHSFTGGVHDGKWPLGGTLALAGNTLYGMTPNGGVSNMGVVFRMNTNGGNYRVIHHFTGGISNGAYPYGSLTLSGGGLYGMTTGGGATNNLTTANGTVFRMDTNGNQFSVLHSFGGGPPDGSYPMGSLILAGDTFYGLTYTGTGYSNQWGVVFRMDTNGSNYSILRRFGTPASDGLCPQGTLALQGALLYGMTYVGGVSNFGVVFRIDTNGNNYTILNEFKGPDGREPDYVQPLILGRNLYGVTYSGGASNGGVMFMLTNTVPSAVRLTDMYLEYKAGGWVVCWRTESEMEALGFDLYREENGAWVKVNLTMVPAQGWPAGGIGAEYCVADPGASPDGVGRYKLVEIETNGDQLEYGPWWVVGRTVQLNRCQASPAGVIVQWTSRDNEVYALFKAVSLRGPFVPLATGLAATPPLNVYTDEAATAVTAFYCIESIR